MQDLAQEVTTEAIKTEILLICLYSLEQVTKAC